MNTILRVCKNRLWRNIQNITMQELELALIAAGITISDAPAFPYADLPMAFAEHHNTPWPVGSEPWTVMSEEPETKYLCVRQIKIAALEAGVRYYHSGARSISHLHSSRTLALKAHLKEGMDIWILYPDTPIRAFTVEEVCEDRVFVFDARSFSYPHVYLSRPEAEAEKARREAQ